MCDVNIYMRFRLLLLLYFFKYHISGRNGQNKTLWNIIRNTKEEHKYFFCYYYFKSKLPYPLWHAQLFFRLTIFRAIGLLLRRTQNSQEKRKQCTTENLKVGYCCNQCRFIYTSSWKEITPRANDLVTKLIVTSMRLKRSRPWCTILYQV
jgi:hypothetical protein